MQYNLKYTYHDDYLYVKVIGNRPAEPCLVVVKSSNSLQEIYSRSKEGPFKKILIRWEVVGDINRETALEILKEIGGLELEKYQSIAFFMPDSTNVRKVKFLDQLAQKLNWNYLFFDDLDEAKKWIKEN